MLLLFIFHESCLFFIPITRSIDLKTASIDHRRPLKIVIRTDTTVPLSTRAALAPNTRLVQAPRTKIAAPPAPNTPAHLLRKLHFLVFLLSMSLNGKW